MGIGKILLRTELAKNNSSKLLNSNRSPRNTHSPKLALQRYTSFVHSCPFQVQLRNIHLFLSSQIRMQAQGNVIQGSMMGNFINIYQEEGTRGLWKVQRSFKNDSSIYSIEIVQAPNFNLFSLRIRVSL